MHLKGEKLNSESSNMLKAPRQHLAVLASGCKLKITKAWNSPFDALRDRMRSAFYFFFLSETREMCVNLCVKMKNALRHPEKTYE